MVVALDVGGAMLAVGDVDGANVGRLDLFLAIERNVDGDVCISAAILPLR